MVFARKYMKYWDLYQKSCVELPTLGIGSRMGFQFQKSLTRNWMKYPSCTKKVWLQHPPHGVGVEGWGQWPTLFMQLGCDIIVTVVDIHCLPGIIVSMMCIQHFWSHGWCQWVHTWHIYWYTCPIVAHQIIWTYDIYGAFEGHSYCWYVFFSSMVNKYCSLLNFNGHI